MRASLLAAACAIPWVAAPVRAQAPASPEPNEQAADSAAREPAAAPVASSPPGTAALLESGADWPAGPVRGQLDRDPTLIPFGKGAVFVPSMTNSLDEPPVTIWRDGTKIEEATTGKRIVLAPGDYEVLMGSGAIEQQFSQRVTVAEGHTSVVPASWAGLTVHVVDDRYSSLRGSYELIRMDDREYIGVGFGADEQAGEPVSTWLLNPGLYKVVRVGESYRARTDFSTVRLLPGHHTHYLLVVDDVTGGFLGAGEVSEDELFRPQEGIGASLVFGGDASLNSRSNVLGAAEGESYAVNAFVDARLNLEIAANPLVLQLQIEEGQGKQPDLPWQNTRDRADLDALYIYRWQPWVGPYVRFSGESNLFDAYEYFGTLTTRDVRVYDADGELLRELLDRNRVRLKPSFGLFTLREGAGVNLRVLKTLFAETNVRVGMGARHLLPRGLVEPTRGVDTACDDAEDCVVYQEVPPSDQWGIEGTLLAIGRLTSYVIVNLEVDSLAPFDDLQQIVIDANATLAVKLTQYASVNYVFRFRRDRSISELDELEHDLLLRFSVALP